MSINQTRKVMPNSKSTRTTAKKAYGTKPASASRGDWEYPAVKVTSGLKRELQQQAKTAGLPLSKWVRTRLDFGDISPHEVRAFLNALVDLGARIDRSNAEANARLVERTPPQ